MSHLKSLKLASAQPARTSADPVQRARTLEEQKAAADAKNCRSALRTHTQGVAQERSRGAGAGRTAQALRQGWFKDASGKTFFALRYAGRAIEFAKDKNAIEVGELENLPAILDQLIEAVRVGELDQQLTAAAEARRQQLSKGKAS